MELERQAGGPLGGEVVGVRDALTLVYPFGPMSGIRRGKRVRLLAVGPAHTKGDVLVHAVDDRVAGIEPVAEDEEGDHGPE